MADSKYILTSSKVVKRFGGLTAVNNMTVNIERNRITSIIGPNGAGKTTFFNAISALYHCEEGTIEFEGTRIEKMKPYDITSLGMARTFQNIRLFGGMTVIENIMVGAYTRLKQNPIQAVFRSAFFKKEEKEAQARAEELMAYVGLKDVGNELAGSLPYGAQRRVEIARALASQPKLLLLDEPAAGMNPAESEDALNLFRRIRDELGHHHPAYRARHEGGHEHLRAHLRDGPRRADRRGWARGHRVEPAGHRSLPGQGCRRHPCTTK